MIKYVDYKQEIKFAVDAVCIATVDGKEHVLLMKRQYEPYKEHWAIPGGFLRNDEELYEAAVRELKEETNISADINDIEEIGIFAKVGRDPRRRIISVAFLIKLDNLADVSISNETLEVSWFATDELKELKLAFDHEEIIAKALGLKTPKQ